MSSRPNNVLFIMTDEHARDISGCYGHPFVQTPNIDKLASRGTRFTNTYTPSPICVPARASLATGRYVHQHRFWSNAQAYDGSIASFGHRLMEGGHNSVSVGKLHYKNSENDNGFSEEILPLHIREGIGWTRGLLRGDLMQWDKAGDFASEIGPGECDYTHYDRSVCDKARDWLKKESHKHGDKAWCLYVSFVTPHYPLIVPQKFFDLYPLELVGLPPEYLSKPPLHPVVKKLREFLNYDDYFDDHTRKIARACYFGMCTFVDKLIGKILGSLEETGQLHNTTVIYTSDHGEMLGNRSIWTKCTMYDEASAIPMIVSGPRVPENQSVDTLSSLVDCYPTIVETCGMGLTEEEQNLPGVSLIDIANGAQPDRNILSEYHDGGSVTGMFMLRHKHWKYNVYPGYETELFDLRTDPRETKDLAKSNQHREIKKQCDGLMREIVDPEATNTRAFEDQATLIESLGGRQAILDSLDYDHSPVPG